MNKLFCCHFLWHLSFDVYFIGQRTWIKRCFLFLLLFLPAFSRWDNKWSAKNNVAHPCLWSILCTLHSAHPQMIIKWTPQRPNGKWSEHTTRNDRQKICSTLVFFGENIFISFNMENAEELSEKKMLIWDRARGQWWHFSNIWESKSFCVRIMIQNRSTKFNNHEIHSINNWPKFKKKTKSVCKYANSIIMNICYNMISS